MPSPLPLWCSALLLALPGVWAAGRWMAARALADAGTARLLAPGLGAAAWLLAVHACALVTGSFQGGLVAGTALVALAGAFAWSRSRGALAAAEERGPRRWALIASTAAATLLLAPAALGWAFHDELFMTGHMSIVAQLQNDFYPPVNMTFPQVDLRYHYGFDLLAAMVTALLRLRVAVALDLVTLGGFAYTWALLFRYGERTLGGARAALVPALTLLGGGLALACDDPGAALVSRMIGMCSVGTVALNPPVVSYAFQHPFSAGLPFAACALHVMTSRDAPPARRLPAVGLLLLALSTSQIVLFASFAGAFALAELLSRAPERRARLLGLGALLAALAALAPLLGGFFGASELSAGSSLVLGVGPTPSRLGDLRWTLQTFGLLLPLGLWGLRERREHRVLLGALLFGGLACVLGLRYRHSPDMAKFATVAALSLGLLGAHALGALLAAARPRWQRLAAAGLLTAALVPGVAFPAAFALGLRGIPEGIFPRAAPPPTPDDAQAITWLRAHVQRGELVYVSPESTFQYAIWGGLPQVWIDQMVSRFGFAKEVIAARQHLTETLPGDPAAWVAADVRWFVDDGKIPRLGVLTRRWQQAGAAQERARFGAAGIYELTGPKAR